MMRTITKAVAIAAISSTLLVGPAAFGASPEPVNLTQQFLTAGAVVDSLHNSVRSSSNMVYAKVASAGQLGDNNYDVDIGSGVTINARYGYPNTNSNTNIEDLFEDLSTRVVVSGKSPRGIGLMGESDLAISYAIFELLDRLARLPLGARDRLMRELRRIRKQAALIVALADIAGSWSLGRATAALRAFADAAIGRALDQALIGQSERGEVVVEDAARPGAGSGLIVLGMGKLGAGELNYSSDVDLIVLFDPERFRYRGVQGGHRPDWVRHAPRAGVVEKLAKQEGGALAAFGFKRVVNVAEGFEGDLDEQKHRGSTGWKAVGLPWKQS